MSLCAADVTRNSPDIKQDVRIFTSTIRDELTTHDTSVKSLPVPGWTNTQPRLQIDKPQTNRIRKENMNSICRNPRKVVIILNTQAYSSVLVSHVTQVNYQ